jgi:hypothetical protein
MKRSFNELETTGHKQKSILDYVHNLRSSDKTDPISQQISSDKSPKQSPEKSPQMENFDGILQSNEVF